MSTETTREQQRSATHLAYDRAIAAEERFKQALRQQFGPRYNPELRYRPKTHNDATRRAAIEVSRALKDWRRESRVLSSLPKGDQPMYHMTEAEADDAYDLLCDTYCMDPPRPASQCLEALQSLPLHPNDGPGWIRVHEELGAHQDAVDSALYGRP